MIGVEKNKAIGRINALPASNFMLRNHNTHRFVKGIRSFSTSQGTD